MMTPMLEALVLANKAEVKTHNHGVGGVGCISVPPGKQIVVTQILWHPFVDIQNSEDQERDAFFNSGAFLHTLKLRNKGKKYAFTFRDTFRCAVFGNSGRGPKTLFYPESATVIDTYLPFTQGNVDFDIMRFNDFRNWGVFGAILPGSTLEPEPSEGYGNQVTTNQFQEVQNVSYYGLVPPPWNPPSYVPPTTSRLTTFSSQLANEFEGDLPLTMPPNRFGFPPQGAPKDTDISMFPVITFTYVLLNNRYVPGDTLDSSGIKTPIKK